jgi:hypothetical protein
MTTPTIGRKKKILDHPGQVQSGLPISAFCSCPEHRQELKWRKQIYTSLCFAHVKNAYPCVLFMFRVVSASRSCSGERERAADHGKIFALNTKAQGGGVPSPPTRWSQGSFLQRDAWENEMAGLWDG